MRLNKWLILILILTFIVRLVGINITPYADESQLVYFPATLTLYKSFDIQYQPPVFEFITRAIYFFFGLRVWAFRLIFILFGLVSIYFTYLLSELLFNKKTAIISSVIMGLSFWHILASLQIERDGAILTFFYIATIYFFVKYDKTKNLKFAYLSGLFLGLAFLTKTSAIILVLILFIFAIIKTFSLKSSLKKLFIPYIIGGFIFASYLIILYMLSPPIFMKTLRYGSTQLSSFSPQILIYLIIWGGPFLLGLSLFRYTKLKLQLKSDILWIWVIAPIVVYSFLGTLMPFDRYLMIIIPPLSIIAAIVIEKIRLTKQDIIITSIISCLFLAFLVYINSNIIYLPHDLSLYFSKLATFDWNFYFPITGPAGPTFGISLDSILFSLILSFLFITLAIVIPKKLKLFRVFFIAFLAVSIAFNFLLIKEFLIPTLHPNISKTTKEVIAYYNENNFQDPVYSNMPSLMFFLDKTEGKNFYRIIYGTDVSDSAFLKSNIAKIGGTAIIVQYPRVDNNLEELKIIKDKCMINQTFYSNNMPVAYIWKC